MRAWCKRCGKAAAGNTSDLVRLLLPPRVRVIPTPVLRLLLLLSQIIVQIQIQPFLIIPIPVPSVLPLHAILLAVALSVLPIGTRLAVLAVPLAPATVRRAHLFGVGIGLLTNKDTHRPRLIRSVEGISPNDERHLQTEHQDQPSESGPAVLSKDATQGLHVFSNLHTGDAVRM